MEIMQKQIEEERAHVPKATYTTNFPVPPKSEPNQIIKEEPFQLDSLARYGEEIRREMEERQCGKTRG